MGKHCEMPFSRNVSSVVEEKIYDFRRRCVFSPSITGNSTIRFCEVSGPKGAQSQCHTHPGDEIVFTLQGESVNRVAKQDVLLRANQAIAILPGTSHSTIISSSGEWRGVSFYCDDCPLLRQHQGQMETDCEGKHVGVFAAGCADCFQKKAIFSPARTTRYLEFFVLSCNRVANSETYMYRGETVYYVLSGAISLLFQEKKILLKERWSVILPSHFPHRLSTITSRGSVVVAGSCSSCPLTGKSSA